jgi:hypothetical protein
MVARFNKFVSRLASQETSVGSVQHYFTAVFNDGKLDAELKILAEHGGGATRATTCSRDWRARAEESIRQLFAINKYQTAASAVSQAAAALQLRERFPVVERILSSTGDKDGGFLKLQLKQVSSKSWSNLCLMVYSSYRFRTR